MKKLFVLLYFLLVGSAFAAPTTQPASRPVRKQKATAAKVPREISRFPRNKRFGIIINGDHVDKGGRHKRNATQAFAAMKKFSITILPGCMLIAKSAGDNFLRAFKPCLKVLRQKMSQGSYLFVYVTGHGRGRGKSNFEFGRDTVLASLFTQQLRSLKSRVGYLTYVGDQCWGGKFPEKIKKAGFRGQFFSLSYNCLAACQHFTPEFWRRVSQGDDINNALYQSFRLYVSNIKQNPILARKLGRVQGAIQYGRFDLGRGMTESEWKYIKKASQRKPVVVIFSTSWCGFCKVLKKRLPNFILQSRGEMLWYPYTITTIKGSFTLTKGSKRSLKIAGTYIPNFPTRTSGYPTFVVIQKGRVTTPLVLNKDGSRVSNMGGQTKLLRAVSAVLGYSFDKAFKVNQPNEYKEYFRYPQRIRCQKMAWYLKKHKVSMGYCKLAPKLMQFSLIVRAYRARIKVSELSEWFSYCKDYVLYCFYNRHIAPLHILRQFPARLKVKDWHSHFITALKHKIPPRHLVRQRAYKDWRTYVYSRAYKLSAAQVGILSRAKVPYHKWGKGSLFDALPRYILAYVSGVGIKAKSHKNYWKCLDLFALLKKEKFLVKYFDSCLKMQDGYTYTQIKWFFSKGLVVRHLYGDYGWRSYDTIRRLFRGKVGPAGLKKWLATGKRLYTIQTLIRKGVSYKTYAKFGGGALYEFLEARKLRLSPKRYKMLRSSKLSYQVWEYVPSESYEKWFRFYKQRISLRFNIRKQSHRLYLVRAIREGVKPEELLGYGDKLSFVKRYWVYRYTPVSGPTCSALGKQCPRWLEAFQLFGVDLIITLTVFFVVIFLLGWFARSFYVFLMQTLKGLGLFLISLFKRKKEPSAEELLKEVSVLAVQQTLAQLNQLSSPAPDVVEEAEAETSD